MDGRSSRLTLLALALSVGFVAACGGGRSAPQALPPQTLVDEPSSESEADVPPPEAIVEEPEKPETLIVLEEAGPVDAAPTLVEAAEAERVRRARATRSTLRLTDKNLSHHAVGELTTSTPTAAPAEAQSASNEIKISGTAPAPDQAASPTPPVASESAGAPAGDLNGDLASDPADSSDESYWRNRVLDIRLRWRAAYDSIEALEGQAAKLRNNFYAEDDPYYRDTQIKPAWDRAIEDLESAREDVVEYEKELGSVVDDGRRSGAMPGWLREGIEHEPPTGGAPSDRIDPDHYAVDPVIYEGGDGP